MFQLIEWSFREFVLGDAAFVARGMLRQALLKLLKMATIGQFAPEAKRYR